MERAKYWYSIISYWPDKLKNESLNVGVIVHNPDSRYVKWFLIDEKNKKLKSILTNHVLVEEYKVRKALFDYKLEKSVDNKSLLDYPLDHPELLRIIDSEVPTYFKMTKHQLIKSSNIDMTFHRLLEIYIDRLFINNGIVTKSVKQEVRDVFESRNLLGVKVKHDVSITPVKELENLQYKIDFVYKNSNLHLVQTLPTNLSHLNEWFSKLKLLQSEYKDSYEIEIIYNEEVNSHPRDVKNILTYLNRSDNTEIIKLNTKEFNNFCVHISNDSLPIQEFEADLLAM